MCEVVLCNNIIQVVVIVIVIVIQMDDDRVGVGYRGDRRYIGSGIEISATKLDRFWKQDIW